jgi:hypothetical protein
VSATLEHLQAAALEMIAALRSALDLAEDLVKDPPLAAAGNGLAVLLAQALQSVQPLLGGERRYGSGEDPQPAPRVEHIRVS